jgi:hypothetical protein
MPILVDIQITLMPEEIIGSRGPIRPAILQMAQEALEMAKQLWRPMAVYQWFDLLAVADQCLLLSVPDRPQEKATLQVGSKAELLMPAERVLISVGTVGPALEQRVHDLDAAGESLQAYLLDSAGVVALGAVGEAVRCLAEEAAASLGWGVSPSLSPGSLVGWPLQGQREVCSLLPLEAIGVQLNRYCVLEPHKSASGLIGLGPGYEATHVGSVCRYCALADTCWRRREDLG